MSPFSGVLELLIFKIFWPLKPNRDTKLSLNPPRGPFNVKMLHPPLLIRNLRSKMLKRKLSLSAHLPASPYFSNYDYDEHHKPNNFEIEALENSHKLHGFCIKVKEKNEVLVASWIEVATPYFIFTEMNIFWLDKSLFTN